MSFERTPYDYEMLRNYKQEGSFHAAPWPTPRSKTDLRLQHEWCPTCEHPIPTPPRPPSPAPASTLPRPRPHIIPGPYGGGATPPVREHYGSVMHNPYQACGNTHSSGPASMASTWEPMQMPMGANTECCCADPAQEQCAGPTSFGCSQGSCPQDQDCYKTQNGKFVNEYC